MFKYTPLLTRCRVATKNANAGELLYRIAFWMPKATIVIGGQKWIANSAVQWTNETGLTVHQYRRAIARLKKLKFVETGQHLFYGKNVTHVRLTDQGRAAIEAPLPDQGTPAPPANANSAQPDKCKSAQLNIQGESSLESLQGESNIAFASAHAICSGSEKEQESAGKMSKKECNPVSKKYAAQQVEEKFEKGIGGPQINSLVAGVSIPTPADIFASNESPGPTSAVSIAHPAPVLQPNKIQASNPATLAALWKILINKQYGDYVPEFTKKEFGQLKLFIDGCPAGQALQILERCLRDWDGFTGYAKDNYSAFPLPARPTLDFLVKNRAAAINFAMKKIADEAKAAKQAAMPKGVLFDYQEQKTAAPVFKPPVKKPEPEPIMTKEEVLASIAEEAKQAVGVAAGHKKSVAEKPKGIGLTIDEMMKIEEEKYYASLDPPK